MTRVALCLIINRQLAYTSLLKAPQVRLGKKGTAVTSPIEVGSLFLIAWGKASLLGYINKTFVCYIG